MFQTELHIALQTLASDFFTAFWRAVTVTQNGWFVTLVLLAVIFGVSLRRGFMLFQIVSWIGLVTDLAKSAFALPRPFFADSRVACLDPHWEMVTPFRGMGGKEFLSLPDPAVVDAFRLHGHSFGFPSGHTSGACAQWGGLALLFRRRALYWLAPPMVALVAFSRLYLGVHFLADILGGLLVGAAGLYVAARYFGDGGGRFLAAARLRLACSLPSVLALLFLFLVPAALALAGLFSPYYAGLYIGMNAAFALASRSGLPAEGGSLSVRLARVALGGLLFWIVSLGMRQALGLLPALAGSGWGRFLLAGVSAFLTLWGGLLACLRLGLYARSGE